MLGQRHRFHGYNSLRPVYRRGQSLRGPMISLIFSRRPVARSYRVAVVVSRKVNKSAVVRNRIRRRVYEIVRQTDSQLDGLDLIFTIYSDRAATLDAEKLKTQVNTLLSRAVKQ